MVLELFLSLVVTHFQNPDFFKVKRVSMVEIGVPFLAIRVFVPQNFDLTPINLCQVFVSGLQNRNTLISYLHFTLQNHILDIIIPLFFNQNHVGNFTYLIIFLLNVFLCQTLRIRFVSHEFLLCSQTRSKRVSLHSLSFVHQIILRTTKHLSRRGFTIFFIANFGLPSFKPWLVDQAY